jgi:antitoxin ParD1/3/4
MEVTGIMPMRNVKVTNAPDRSVTRKVKAGRYEAKLAALRAAIDEGDASGVAQGNVFARTRKTLKLTGSSRWRGGVSSFAT